MNRLGSRGVEAMLMMGGGGEGTFLQCYLHIKKEDIYLINLSLGEQLEKCSTGMYPNGPIRSCTCIILVF